MKYSDKNQDLVKIEESLKRRLDYEHATIKCMRTLLELGSQNDILPRILNIVHEVVDNSRTYIFKNELDPELGLCMSQIYEAVSDGIEAQIDNPDLQHLSYKEATPTLFSVLKYRQYFAHLVEELDGPEKTLLSEQGILSILIIPIFAGQEFWGFIGFDDCIETREWDGDDISLLTVVADGIGEFIFRRKAEDELKESEERFKTLHNATFGGILIHDKGKILDCNQGLSDMTGYSKEELLAGDSFKIVTEESKAIIMERLASGSEETYEIVGLRKDGTEYPMRVQAKNIPYKGKQVRVTELRDVTEQKKSENALRESEEKLGAMIANIADVIAIIDKNGINKYKSPNIEKWFGWKPEEIIGTSTWNNIHPEDLDYTLEFFSSILDKPGATVNAESRYRCKDGSYKWMEFTAINLLEEPAISGILLNYHDIDERKQAEDALRESEAKQRAMIANSNDIIAIINEEGINRYKSPNVEKWFGWKPEELIGNSVWDNIHPDELKYTKELFPMFLTIPESMQTSETRYRCKDGNYKWIEYTITNLLHEPSINGVLLNYHDITERKLAENALRESERKFRNYLENAPYGIFIIDENGNYLEVNKTACMLTGYDESELVGMNITDLIASESLIKSGHSLDELKSTGFTSTELQVKHKNGNVSWIRRDGSKLANNKYITFSSDITEKKRAEHSLVQAKILAEDNNRIKSEFLANMSHELRTPLTAVIGFSDILDAGVAGVLTEKQLRYVNHINKSGKHLLEIINDILDISKVEAGKMELVRETFSITSILKEILESMSAVAGKKNIKLKLMNELNATNIIADKVKFQQILFNLLSNAIKFTPENGEVSVIIKRTDNAVLVSVMDTGIGISEDMKYEIFNPFTQVDASSKRKYGGTGLGLALVKQFVEMHDGKIWLESEEGKGSTFTFTVGNQKL